MKDLFILIPAYNEQKTVADVAKLALAYTKNVVVIDDGSRDETFEKASTTNATVLRHIINLGKGAALRTGCEYAINKGARYIILIDADGQHSTKQIPDFINKLENADIVFGARKLNLRQMPLLKKIGNFGLNLITRSLFNIKIDDALCGYRAFRTEIYRKILWKSSGYEVEVEMIAQAGKHKLRTAQLPIETIYSDHYRGITIFDGIRIGLNMLWWKLTR